MKILFLAIKLTCGPVRMSLRVFTISWWKISGRLPAARGGENFGSASQGGCPLERSRKNTGDIDTSASPIPFGSSETVRWFMKTLDCRSRECGYFLSESWIWAGIAKNHMKCQPNFGGRGYSGTDLRSLLGAFVTGINLKHS